MSFIFKKLVSRGCLGLGRGGKGGREEALTLVLVWWTIQKCPTCLEYKCAKTKGTGRSEVMQAKIKSLKFVVTARGDYEIKVLTE